MNDTAEEATTDSVEDLGADLFVAIGRLTRWSARQGPDPYPAGVLSALGTLVDLGPLRLGDLAAREGVSPASLSRTIGLLEGTGLISRLIDPADRRSSFVEASEAGTFLVHTRRRERGRKLAAQLRPLTEAELVAIRSIVEAVDQLTSG